MDSVAIVLLGGDFFSQINIWLYEEVSDIISQ